MTQEELTQYVEQCEKFENECNRVCGILTNSKKRHGYCSDINYAERFHLTDDSVAWEGDEYWSYGGHEEHSGYFPADFLTMSDDELLKIVEKENEELEARQEKKRREQKERERAQRLAEYEKLKEEFGG